MKSIIALIPDEELREIRRRYDLLLQNGIPVTMDSLEFADTVLALYPKFRDGFTVSYLPNIEEHATSLAIRRYIQYHSFDFGDDVRERRIIYVLFFLDTNYHKLATNYHK